MDAHVVQSVPTDTKDGCCPPTDLMPEVRANFVGWRPVWFEDEKRTKNKVLHHSWFLTRSLSARTVLSGQKWKLITLDVFICKLRKLILIIRSKDWGKNPYIYQPTDPPLEDVWTEVVWSGQRWQIKIPGINGNVSASFTYDPIDLNASQYQMETAWDVYPKWLMNEEKQSNSAAIEDQKKILFLELNILIFSWFIWLYYSASIQ